MLILDEVGNHLGFTAQSVLWRDPFGKLSMKYQPIVSTHSLLPILLKRDNLLRQDSVVVPAEKCADVRVFELARAVEYFNATNGRGGGQKKTRDVQKDTG